MMPRSIPKHMTLFLTVIALFTAVGRADVEELVVPVISDPELAPKIDGDISPGEWRWAVGLTGLTNLEQGRLSSRDARVYFVADEENLYIGVRAEFEGKGRPKGHEFERDDLEEAFKGDRIEINVCPPEEAARGEFYLIAGPTGSFYDSVVPAASVRDYAGWDTNWTVESSVEDGTWNLEVSAPVTEFEMPAGKPEGRWALNVSLAPPGGGKNYDGLVRDPHGQAPARLVRGVPAVHVEELGRPSEGVLNLIVSALGPRGAQTGPLTVSYEVKRKNGESYVDGEGELQLAPGKKTRLQLEENFTPRPDSILVLKVAGEGGNVYHASLPLGSGRAGAGAGESRPSVPLPVRLEHPPRTPAERDLPLVVWTERRSEPEPMAIHVLRVDTKVPDLKVDVLLAEDPDGEGEAEAALTDPRKLAARHGALAAVNANGFAALPDAEGNQPEGWRAGWPVDVAGIAVSESTTRSGPYPNRSNDLSFWIDGEGQPHIGAIPGEDAEVREAVNGWWIDLVRGGKVVPKEGGKRHPRTAVGLDEEGRVLLVVVDGRQGEYSVGMTGHELAELMVRLGAHRAINLDGGGSSIMLAAGADGEPEIVNRPSGDRPRPLPLLLGVTPRWTAK